MPYPAPNTWSFLSFSRLTILNIEIIKEKSEAKSKGNFISFRIFLVLGSHLSLKVNISSIKAVISKAAPIIPNNQLRMICIDSVIKSIMYSDPATRQASASLTTSIRPGVVIVLA
jgi:hypothetical protein